MRRIALVGKNLSSSFSIKFFNEKIKKENIKNLEYVNLEINRIDQLHNYIKKKNIIGLNVTSPYKLSIKKYFNKIDDVSSKIGAINTIKVEGSDLIGFNTDYLGFMKAYKKQLSANKKCLVLGDGGASKGIQYVLRKLNIEYLVISRRSKFDYEFLKKNNLIDFDIIINTTTLGMVHNIDRFPDINYDQVNETHTAIDLIYNPAQTMFLKKCQKKCANTLNGHEMLLIKHLKVGKFGKYSIMNFKLESSFKPTGDQPKAINELVSGLNNNFPYQTLLGVTGSGKTFTVANVIKEIGRPTLVLSHNKTLAAQLFSEFKSFFPNNCVEYFVSYYDYYQPEAYIPSTGIYIEKDLSINEEIEKYRLKATSSLLSGRKDIIVVSSVSCIYGMGNPDDYYNE